MNKKEARTLDSVCKDIYSFLELHLFNRVQYKCPTWDDYKNKSHDTWKQLRKLLHVDREIVRSLASYGHNRYYSMHEVWQCLEPQIVHHCKCTRTYKSGKKFQLDSWYHISDKKLCELYANPPAPSSLTPRAKAAWEKFISKTKKKEKEKLEDMDTTQTPTSLLEANAKAARRAAERAKKKSQRLSASTPAEPAIPHVPAYDIPADTAPHMQGDAKASLAKELQELVSKKVLGLDMSKRLAAIAGISSFMPREPRDGITLEDLNDTSAARHHFLKGMYKSYLKANVGSNIKPEDFSYVKSLISSAAFRMNEQQR